MTTFEYLQLADWRRRVAELFSEARRRPADATTQTWFRAHKDELFRTHPQSPLPAGSRGAFPGLRYWPYDPEARVLAQVVPEDVAEAAVPGSTDEAIPLHRIGRLDFIYDGAAYSLGLFWVAGYGGGLFVPFRDATSGSESYGGGRYLIDAVKSADLGSDDQAGTVTLDFNYAYHPSCFYDPHWSCPLAPPGNWLAVAVKAGERA